VAEAVKDGKLSLHGLWNHIGDGGLEAYNPEKNSFLPV
jgi:carbonic anhydrase